MPAVHSLTERQKSKGHKLAEHCRHGNGSCGLGELASVNSAGESPAAGRDCLVLVRGSPTVCQTAGGSE